MASKKKQKGMVLHREGAATPAANCPPTWVHAAGPGSASRGGTSPGNRVNRKETTEPNMIPSEDAVRMQRRSRCCPGQSVQCENLSPDSVCKGIKVTLDNNSMWNEFFRCRTEMIVTTQGSRMFPYCRFRITGLQPTRTYSLLMDIQSLDNSQYEWTGKTWQATGKAQRPVKTLPFAHPESPATGEHWMRNPVSFFRLKLTNNVSDQEGNTILHPMQRYLPRLHVVPTDNNLKEVKLSSPSVTTITFPQTEFIAVTTYQNSQFTQLKVQYNPFSKGSKEDGPGLWGHKLISNTGKELHKVEGTSVSEQHPVKKSLKFLLANHKPKSSVLRSSKPPLLEDSIKNDKLATDLSTSIVPKESSCNTPRSGPKLFSELIREAHVSLHRCDQQLLGINHSSFVVEEPSNTDTFNLEDKGQDVFQNNRMSTANTNKSEVMVAKGTDVENRSLLESLDCNNTVRLDISDIAAETGPQKTSGDSDHQNAVKQQKRPARLPLPALARFLKQHSSKSKKTGPHKPNSPPPVPPPQSESVSPSLPPELSTCAPSPSKKNGSETPEPVLGVHSHPDEVVLNVTGKMDETAHRFSTPSCSSAAAKYSEESRTDFHVNSEKSGLNPTVHDGTPVLPKSDQLFRTSESSTENISISLATFRASSPVSPPQQTVLPTSHSPQTQTESPTLPTTDSVSMQSKSLPPDPECSSFGFDSLSNASSPEPLPSLSAFELETTASEAAESTGSHENLSQEKVSSVLTWHTVLPPPEPYVDPSITAFQAGSPPLMPPQSPTHPEPQSRSSSTPPHPGPDPSLQDGDQSLPFPAELSPLTLQLPLSPSFSSLDGEGLSPTPSLTDLVHFFSTDDALGMEFSNAEPVVDSCSAPTPAKTQEPSQEADSSPPTKTLKQKKFRHQTPGQVGAELPLDEDSYRSMQPSLEEVEEQLFVSFTSKEALKLHVEDSSTDPLSQPRTEELQIAEAPTNDTDETISAFQKVLLKDLKRMKHRQVIHPVLQEVGLKMYLLDPTQSIDLKYLGVRLPIPPPGASTEPAIEELPSSQALSTAFVSRTGKTTDVTQIKGWRDKFSPSEAPPTPEVGVSVEPQKKKNLSAFCSDMLDEYLENEGKLIDQRASSFSQPLVEPPVYQMPTKSTSYVRTLDHILTKQSPTSDLISGFIPPSKRPRVTEPKTIRKRPRILKPKSRAESVAVAGPQSDPADPAEETDVPSASEPPSIKKKRLKPKTSSQTLSPPRTAAHPPGPCEDMAPLESDSELIPDDEKSQTEPGKVSRAPTTRSLLKQRDLEEAAIWEGRPRIAVTEVRATVALTSLFTLTGFVSENPLAPIQLPHRHRPRCLNDFCRLGCVCRSLSFNHKPNHCGRIDCMFHCSCLKQKVVILKNLDGSDSSPSFHDDQKRRKRKRRRRMKMAYILKEADSVSQPAERIRTLWRRSQDRDSDQEPVYVPKKRPLQTRKMDSHRYRNSCARVRRFCGNKMKEPEENTESKPVKMKRRKRLKEACPPAAGETIQKVLPASPTRPSSSPCPCFSPGQSVSPPPSPAPPDSPSCEATPTPSRRLFVFTECVWKGEAERNFVMRKLCKVMARDQLDKPFWIRKFLIRPTEKTVEGSGPERCIHYRVNISKPDIAKKKSSARNQRAAKATAQQQDNLVDVGWGPEPPEAWQREVEEGDIEEDEEEVAQGSEKREDVKVDISHPFLSGICPAGFLSASLKQPGGTNKLVQVNGKLYPLAKIQLGSMGALHPANRLAAYLTGRVGPNQTQKPPPSPTSTSARAHQSSRSTTTTLTPANLAAAPSPSVTGDSKTNTSITSISTSNTSITTPNTSISSITTQSTSITTPNTSITTSETSISTLTTTFSATTNTPTTAPSSDTSTAAPLGTLSPIKATNPPATPRGSQLFMLRVSAPPASQQPPRFPPPPGPRSGIRPLYKSSNGKLVQVLVSPQRPINPQTIPHRGPSNPLVPSFQSPNASLIKHPFRCPFPSPSSAPPSFPRPPVQRRVGTHMLPPLAPSRKICFLSKHPRPAMEGTSASSSTVFRCPLPINLRTTQPVAQNVSVDLQGPKQPPDQLKPPSPTTSSTDGGDQKPLPSSPPPPQQPGLASELIYSDNLWVDNEEILSTERELQKETSRSEDEDSSDSGDEDSSDSGDEDSSDSHDEDSSVSEDEEKQQEGVVIISSNDMENSSGNEKDKENFRDHRQRHQHNLLERNRRGTLRKKFHRLKEEVGLPVEKSSKVDTLNTAKAVIKSLQQEEEELQDKKKRLFRRWEEQMSIIESMGGTNHSNKPQSVQPIEPSSDQNVQPIEPSSDQNVQPIEPSDQNVQPIEPSSDQNVQPIEPSSDQNVQPIELSSEDDVVEVVDLSDEKIPSTNQLTAKGGASHHSRADIQVDDITVTSSKPHPMSQPPPAGVFAPPRPNPFKFQWPPQVTHNPPVKRTRPRFIPNILSRSKGQNSRINPTQGQPDLLISQPLAALSSMVSGSMVLQDPFNPATNNLHQVTEQRQQATQYIQQGIPQHLQQQTQHTPQTTEQQSPHLTQRPPPLLLPGGSEGHSDSSTLPRPQDAPQRFVGVPDGPGSAQPADGFRSLLDELVFLNQQATVTGGLAPPTDDADLGGGAEAQGHTPTSWFLHSESNPVSMEMNETQLNKQLWPEATNGNATGGVLIPPPLLQMKVGGSTGSEHRERKGGGSEGGGAWRPMPRLVPLGVRGTPPT